MQLIALASSHSFELHNRLCSYAAQAGHELEACAQRGRGGLFSLANGSAFPFRVSRTHLRSKSKKLPESGVFDVWATVLELRQPCLARQLPTNLIGSDGSVSTQTLAAMDRILIEHLDTCLASSVPPTDPIRTITNYQRWVNTSAMQKAIRRGDSSTAVACARSGFQLDPEHTLKRLAVCALEDIGIGNLLAVATALAVAGNSSIRRRANADRFVAYVAKALARSPKSRLACDFLSLVDFDSSLQTQKRAWAQESDDELASRCLAPNTPLQDQMLAAWLLAGTSRFKGVTLPATARRRDRLMRCMAEARMPLILYYIADRMAARTSDAMFISFLPIWRLLRKEPNLSVLSSKVPASPQVHGYPAYAYDMHTQEGRRALHRFAIECSPVRKCVAHLPPRNRATAIGNGVFLVEGALLDRSAKFSAADAINRSAQFKELEYAGIVTAGAQSEFLQTLAEALPVLHRMRWDH